MSAETHDLREEVRAKYAGAAQSVAETGSTCGCGSTCCSDGTKDGDCCGNDCCAGGARGDFGQARYAEDERVVLPGDAVAASLGCGNPTAVADLHEGDTVLDLGSGGGIDVILSARRVGPSGHVYGLDMTDEMLDLARHNAEEAEVANVTFLKGLIEDVPLPDESVDVVISNCVVNLSTEKQTVLREVARVLKPGGRLGISDVVAENHLTPEQRADRGSYVGCIAGALSITEYENGLTHAGLRDVTITLTHQVADGMHGAIAKATKPR